MSMRTAILVLGLFLLPAPTSAQDGGDRATPDLAPPPDKIFRSQFEQYTLTVTNYLAWCSVALDGGAASVAATITKDYPDNSVALLHAEPLQGFVWGYWTGTDADTGGGGDFSKDASRTMGADQSVLACCPFSQGQTCS
jgi:hypothetical protein